MLSNLCAAPSALNFAEIPMIFCRRIFWVDPQCNAKVGHNCSRFCEMAAILIKNHIFALFSQSILVIPTKIGRDIARGKGNLVLEVDFGKWQPVLGSELTFLHFSPNVFSYSNDIW